MESFKRTECSGLKDELDRDICLGDLLQSEDRQVYRCDKDGESWIFVNINSGQRFEGAAAALRIIVFDCEEE